MSLRRRLGFWLLGGKRAATEALELTGYPGESFGQGIGGPHQPPHEILLREELGTFAIGARAIANRMADLNPQVMVTRRKEAGTLRDEVLDDHALKLLLDRPHPNFTRGQLFRLTAQWILTTGEGFWLKVGNGLGVPVELHPIPPKLIEPRVRRGIVESYVVREATGQERTLRPNEVVRFYFPDPEDPWRSEGYLGPHAIIRDAMKFATEHLRYHFQHNATPKTVLEAQENAQGFGEEARKAFRELWKQLYNSRKGSDSGVPAITPTGYKLKELKGMKGAELTPILEFYRDEELLATGTPRSILGQVLSGDRSSAETNQYVFDKHTVSPIANMMAETLTLQLAPDFESRVWVRFEPFVSEDKDFELRKEAQDLEHGVRTINRVLEDRGDDPVEWGERPLTKSDLKVFDPSRPAMEPEDETPPAEAEDTDESDEEDEERLAREAHIAIRRLDRARKRKARVASA